MTIIYCAQDKRKEVQQALKPEAPYVFASPNDQAIDHTATRVIIVGPHQQIEQRYKGIAKIEYYETGDSSQPETEDQEDTDE